MILVVGATGMLGTAICTRLASEGYAVLGLVRPTSDTRLLGRLGVELAVGDLRDADSVRAAVSRADAVVAAASAVPGGPNAGFEVVEGDGYFNLLRACQRNTIDRFVYLSVPETPMDDLVPSHRLKRLNERRLRKSGVPYTIVRTAPLMEDALAVLGTSVPLRGLPPQVLNRRPWSTRIGRAVTGAFVDVGVALVPGHGWTRHAFVALDDVAAFVVEALFRSDPVDRVYEVGGPDVLSWNEAVGILAGVLRRPAMRVHVPTSWLRAAQVGLERVAPHGANRLGRLWIQARWDTPYLPEGARPVLDTRSFTTMEQLLRRKAALPRQRFSLRPGLLARRT